MALYQLTYGTGFTWSLLRAIGNCVTRPYALRTRPGLARRHISRSADLAVQFYDVLVRAVEDGGLTVRKRAVRLLWECCVRFPDFTHRTDALLRIIARATDTEVGQATGPGHSWARIVAGSFSHGLWEPCDVSICPSSEGVNSGVRVRTLSRRYVCIGWYFNDA